MAGNTGKMTNEAIIARGQRMRLVRCYDGNKPLGFVIMRDPDSAVGLGVTSLKNPGYRTYAQSYSLSYLRGIAKEQV